MNGKTAHISMGIAATSIQSGQKQVANTSVTLYDSLGIVRTTTLDEYLLLRRPLVHSV
jgi:hypothetical protein